MGTQQLPTKELWCDNCWQRSHSTQACWWKGNNQQAQKHPKKHWAELHAQKLASAASSSTYLDEATRSTRQEAEQSSLTSPCHSALPQASGKENSSFVCLLCESVGSVSRGELLDTSLHPIQQPKSQEQQQLHNQHLRSTQLGSEKLEEAKGKGASTKKRRSSEKTLEDVLSSACVYNLPDLVWHDPSSVFRGQPSRGQLSTEKLGIKTLTNKPAACKHKMLQESPGQSSAETPKTLPTVLSAGELASFQGSQSSFRAMVEESSLEENSFGTAQLRSKQLGTAQLGSKQLGTAQLGSKQLGTAQLRREQLGSKQLGTAQLGSKQLGTAQLGSKQLGTAQLGSKQLGTAQLRSLEEAAWNAAQLRRAWNSAAWKQAAWNSAAWKQAAWNSAAWKQAAWNSAAWKQAAWNSAAWKQAAWNSAASQLRREQLGRAAAWNRAASKRAASKTAASTRATSKRAA